MDLSHILFAIIGMLLGLGGMSFWVKQQSDALALKMQAAEKDIERLERVDNGLQARIDSAIELHAQAVKLLTNVVNQNNLLIQKLLVNNGD